MKIPEKITVSWLKRKQKTNLVFDHCIKGFEKDFGKSIKTRDLIRALNEKNYDYEKIQAWLCYLDTLLLPLNKRLVYCGDQDCCDCKTPEQFRRHFYKALRAQGGVRAGLAPPARSVGSQDK